MSHRFYSVVFVLQDEPFAYAFDGLRTRRLPVETLLRTPPHLADDPVADYALHLEIFPDGDRLRLVVKYDGTRLSPAAIGAFATGFQRVVERLTENPFTRLTDFDGPQQQSERVPASESASNLLVGA